ncbi:M16 family metallopeptidase [Klebsiella sp. BIGb0407]|uniref:M16 family metallopeptidase n=1 Tax=Klebsiella sp. BIGb0407 TaxID=2940603 RepID=UPI002168A1A6|nr:pitrilysin family protein [Klebsiella sp. BIGb0407]MCS3432076.1 zinc protease [Klebsiella sp. BIGb0407]
MSPLPEIITGTLENGLRYTLVPLEGQKKRVDIRLSVDVGSIDEEDGESGVAHIIEHMVFRASKAHPEGVATQLHQQGWVRAQHYNAMTNYERTLYMMSPPGGAQQLDVALQALSQMVGHASLSQSDLDDERRVVLEEWRGKLGVAERMNQQRVRAIRHDSRYPTRPTIGNEHSIRTVPATTLQQFYQRWYHPSNMRLLIIGDFKPEAVVADIQKAFNSLPAGKIPERNYYEPNLEKRLNVARLQDSQSGASQVSFVVRFNPGKTTYRERLINQIAISAYTRQVRRQESTLPPQVGSLVVRKSDIGKTTEALGLFADVMPDGHTVALDVLLREWERMRRYGLNDVDITEIKQSLSETAQRMANQPEEREFAEWVQKITTEWALDKPYTGSQQRGREALELLKTIDNKDVNALVQRWLASEDTLVQFSLPGMTAFTLPTAESIRQKQRQLQTVELEPPVRNIEQQIPQLAVVEKSGSRQEVKHFPEQKVEEWTLSNGDRLVWLRTPLAQDKVWLSGSSVAGFRASELNPWQAQMASQLVAQSGPQGWSGEQLDAWKKQHGISLSIKQQPEELQFSGQSSQKGLSDLLALNHALQVIPGIDDKVLKDSMMRLLRQQTTLTQIEREDSAQKIRQLRYGKPGWAAPEEQQLKQIDSKTLLKQWHTTTSAPVTWYLLADMTEEQLLPLAERYLATIPRQPMSATAPELPRSGQFDASAAVNIEPRANVKGWSFTSQPWSAQKAVQVSIARNLALQALKNSLRDDALGIYRLQMNSELSDTHQRIETELSFTSDPERAQELWQRAEQVFAELPAQITQQQVDEQKAQFIRQERARVQDISTLERRLQLSYRHFDNPGYLSEVTKLADSINLQEVRDAASQLYNPDNRVLHIALPKVAM